MENTLLFYQLSAGPCSTFLAFRFVLFFLWYLTLNSGPLHWATYPALFIYFLFWDGVSITKLPRLSLKLGPLYLSHPECCATGVHHHENMLTRLLLFSCDIILFTSRHVKWSVRPLACSPRTHPVHTHSARACASFTSQRICQFGAKWVVSVYTMTLWLCCCYN